MPRLSRQLQLAALAILWLQLLSHGQLQPISATAIGACLAWALWRPALPQRWLQLLTLALLALWWFSSPLADRGQWLASLCNLLWLFCGLQLLRPVQAGEGRRQLLVQLVAIGLAGLQAQGLGASLMQALAVLINLAAVISLESNGALHATRLWRRLAITTVVLVPPLVMAFLLLPRLPPLWQLELGGSGRSGLSDRMDPGSIASLVQSDAPALQLRFAGAMPPPPQERYWRVLVHQHTDGRIWQSAAEEPTPLPAAARTGPVEQRWIVEPGGVAELPWGGTGQPDQAGLEVNSLGELQRLGDSGQRRAYSISRANPDASWRHVPPSPLDQQLPSQPNPRLRALGRQWNTPGSSNSQRLERATRWFQQGRFRYSLEPGRLPEQDPLDAFLFSTRTGFCEHYAASFSALMRAAGVPARVVVGYQGGTWVQPLAGGMPYLDVRQADAHAWSEVWLDDHRGWVRVDPTAWVAPERVSFGVMGALQRRGEASRLRQPPGWLLNLSRQWAAIDSRWLDWVMGFDQSRQEAWLERWLGPQRRGQGALLLAGGGAGVGLALSWLWWAQRQRPRDALERELLLWCRILQRHGHPPQAGESLEGYARRIAADWPEGERLGLERWIRIYNASRHGPQGSNSTSLNSLRRERAALSRRLRRGRSW